MNDRDLIKLAGLESREEARARRGSYVAHLRNGDASAKVLANKLEACSKRSPCKSGACPLCARELRIRHIYNVTNLDRFYRHQYATIAVTLVPGSTWARGDNLAELDLTVIKQKLGKRLRRAGIESRHLGGVDVSRNEHKGRRYWHAHAQIIAWAEDLYTLAERLRTAFPAGPTAIRPVFVKMAHRLPGAASYTLKSMFVRRVSYVDKSGRRNSRKVRLTGPETRELLCWLDQYPHKHRIIGVEPCSTCNAPHPVGNSPNPK